MDQLSFNKNVANALSIINKSVMSLQDKLIFLASTQPQTTHIADLTRMDAKILDDLQKALDRIKLLV